MNRLLLVFALLAGSLWGAAGDILWVKETVAADTVGVLNTFASPYGIQQAFRSVGQNEEIRIVAGVNNYNSTTASWTNRDGVPTNSAIFVDGVSGAAPVGATSMKFIKVTGYVNETTPCALDANGAPITGCPVTLDFDKAVATNAFASGFDIDEDFYAWSWLRITDVTFCGICIGRTALDGTNHVFYRMQVDDISSIAIGAGSGISLPGNLDPVQPSRTYVIASEVFDVFGVGIDAGPGDVVYMNKVHDNAGGDAAIDCNGCIAISNALWLNGTTVSNQNGIEPHGLGSFVANNTTRTSAQHGIGGSSTNDGGLVMMFNVMEGNENTCSGVSGDCPLGNGGGGFTQPYTGGATYSIAWLTFGNNFGNNAGPDVDIKNDAVNDRYGVVIDAEGLLTGTYDSSTVTFVSSSNPTPTGTSADTTFFYSPGAPAIQSLFQQGAIQIRQGGGGGGGECCWIK